MEKKLSSQYWLNHQNQAWLCAIFSQHAEVKWSNWDVKYAYCFRLAVRTGWTHSNEQNAPSLNKKGSFKLLLHEQIIGPKRGLLTELACLSGHVSWTQWLNVMCLCVLGWGGWGLLLDLSRPAVTCRARQSAIKGQAELLARDSCTEGSALRDHLLISMFAV